MNQQISPTVDQAKAALAGVQTMFQDLLKQRETLQAKRLEIFDAREELLVQPFTKAEVLQAMCEIIDLRAKNYEQRLVDYDLLEQWKFPIERGQGYPSPDRYQFPLALCDLENALGKEEPYRRPKECREGRPPLSRSGSELPIGLFYGEFEIGWQYFYLADVMKEKLCKLFGSAEEGVLQKDGKPNAKSLHERRDAIDEISNNLHELDLEISKIDTDLEMLSKPVVTSANALRKEGATRL